MDFTALVPRRLHSAFANWGKHDWLRYSTIGVDKSLAEVIWPKYDGKIPFAEWDIIRELIQLATADRIKLTWYYLLSKAIAHGPKMFSPNIEQCESMEEIDIDIPTTEYQQPYPTLVHFLPNQWSRDLASRFNTNGFPLFSITHVDVTGFILIGITMSNDDQFIVVIPPDYASIETALHIRMDNRSGENMANSELKMSAHVQRVALNSSVLLMQMPTKTEPLEPREYQKHRTKAHLRQFAIGDFQRISFQQNIVIRDERSAGTHDKTGTGVTPKPHWRRGHWKMVTHGPKHSLRKRMLIKPVFVRGYAFTADMSATSVSMHKVAK